MTLDTLTVPRELIERTVIGLAAAASSAEERGLLLGAQGYVNVLRELNGYLKPPADLSRDEQAQRAGERR